MNYREELGMKGEFICWIYESVKDVWECGYRGVMESVGRSWIQEVSGTLVK